jgi:hypothetical protein
LYEILVAHIYLVFVYDVLYQWGIVEEEMKVVIRGIMNTLHVQRETIASVRFFLEEHLELPERECSQ